MPVCGIDKTTVQGATDHRLLDALLSRLEAEGHSTPSCGRYHGQ